MTVRPDPPGLAPALVPRAPPDDGAPHECRCGCGNLLARLRPEGVELKCRRCKRVVMLALAEPPSGQASPPPPTST